MYREIKHIVKLSFPIAISAIAISLMGIVDTMMVGNYNTEQLAHVGLATAVFVFLFYIPMALLQGVQIRSSQEFGAKKFTNCGKIYLQGKHYAWLLGVMFMLVGLNGQEILLFCGQNAVMAENSGRLLMILALSIPGIMQFENANFFLQSIRRQHVAVYAAVIANLLNIILNYALVYGHWGFPEWGATGSAITTLIVRTFLGIFMLGYIHYMKMSPKLCRRFGLHLPVKRWWQDSRDVRRLGWWIAVTCLTLDGSYLAVNLFAGRLGEIPMATFVIISNITGFIFMIGFAFSQSISIRVANAYGRQDQSGMLRALYAGCLVWAGIFMIISLTLYLFPNAIFGIFTNDNNLLSIIRGMVGLIILECLIENMPLNLNGALNGRGDVKIPSFIQAFSFLVVRLSTASYFTFYLGMGIRGLYWGMICGGISSLTLHLWRLIIVYRQPLGKL